MAKVKIALVGALIVAGVAVSIWQETRIRALAAENARLRDVSAQLAALREEANRLKGEATDRAELARLRADDRQMREEIARLRGQLGARLREEARRESPGQVPTPAASAEVGAGMAQFFQGILDQQAQSRVSKMKEMLGLTPEQEPAITAILRRQSEQGAAVAQKMFTGKLTREEMPPADSAGGNPEEQIKALLSPEQLARYGDYQHEEAVSNARLAANAELLQLQVAVTLKPEQQDQAFAALYDQTLAMIEGSVVEPPRSATPEAIVEWQISRKLKALEGILDADQLRRYRELQETQLKMMKSLLPSAPNPGGP